MFNSKSLSYYIIHAQFFTRYERRLLFCMEISCLFWYKGIGGKITIASMGVHLSFWKVLVLRYLR